VTAAVARAKPQGRAGSRKPVRGAPAPVGDLTIHTTPSESRIAVGLAGELDVGTAADLNAFVYPLAGETTEILLDLGSLTFMDSYGLRALLGLRSMCEDHGCRLLITSVQPAVGRLLESAGVTLPQV
jgi:anti-anti-sigma factor